MEATTTTVAAGAVSSPLWLPELGTVSEVAAMLAPILGAVWLTVQIVSKVYEIWNKRNKDEDRQ